TYGHLTITGAVPNPCDGGQAPGGELFQRSTKLSRMGRSVSPPFVKNKVWNPLSGIFSIWKPVTDESATHGGVTESRRWPLQTTLVRSTDDVSTPPRPPGHCAPSVLISM